MKLKNFVLFLSFCLVLPFTAMAKKSDLALIHTSTSVNSSKNGKYFNRVIFVIFENTNYYFAIRQPFFKKLANNGAHFSNFFALTHPSQPNYIGLTSGSLNGVSTNDPVDLKIANIADLLEAKGLKWKVYAEKYPGNCFTAATKSGYVRKHNPFISYLNIQKDPLRCSNIVNADEFDLDAKNGTLPNYIFYIPDNLNNGHDTGVSYANKWYEQKFSNYISDPIFMKETILVTTFDESGYDFRNHIYTSIVGPAVKPGIYPTKVNLYSLLKLVEENWELGNLGKEDVKAVPIPNIWKYPLMRRNKF